MTVQETILSFPGLADFPQGYLTVILASRSLNGAAGLNSVENKTVSLAIADALAAFVNTPDFTENKLFCKLSEGSLPQYCKHVVSGKW